MAGVLETIAVPRASAFSSARLAPIANSSSSSGRRSSVNFSQFRGLKFQPVRSPVSLSSQSKSVRRGGRVVCEAQETAVQGVSTLLSRQIHYLMMDDCF